MKIIAALGFSLLLLSLPIAALAFLVNSFGLFLAALIIGAIGMLLLSIGVILKLGSLLFRL